MLVGVHERRALDNTTSNGKLSAVTSEEGIDIASALATLVDTPDDQRLSATAVTGSENTGEVGVVVTGRGLDVLAAVKLDNVAHDTLLRAQETHGKQDEVGREELLATLNVLHVPATGGGLGPLNTDSVDTLDLAATVVDEVLGHDTVLTRVLAHVSLDFVVTIVSSEDTGPLWPWVVASTLSWGLGQQLEVDDRLGAVANGSTNAVVTSITTSDDNNVLVLGRNVSIVSQFGVQERLGVLVQELHGVVNAVQVAVRDGQVTSDSSSSREDNCVVLLAESFEVGLTLLTNGDTSLEVDALSSHEVDTALNDLLVELHVGDTVHEETTDTVGTLIDGDSVTSLVELISTSETSRAGTDDGNSLSRTGLGWRRNHPALLKTAVNNGALNRLDANGILVDAKNTGTLARSRANTTSKLRLYGVSTHRVCSWYRNTYEVVGHEGARGP